MLCRNIHTYCRLRVFNKEVMGLCGKCVRFWCGSCELFTIKIWLYILPITIYKLRIGIDQLSIIVFIITHWCPVIVYYFYKNIIYNYINKLLKKQLRENRLSYAHLDFPCKFPKNSWFQKRALAKTESKLYFLTETTKLILTRYGDYG